MGVREWGRLAVPPPPFLVTRKLKSAEDEFPQHFADGFSRILPRISSHILRMFGHACHLANECAVFTFLRCRRRARVGVLRVVVVFHMLNNKAAWR